MEFFLGIVFATVSYIILYFIIKTAVRDGIVEARHVRENQDECDRTEGNAISQTTCPSCGKKHDIDYPKCPYCKHQY